MNLLVWFKDLFVPHGRNNHKAKILHPASLSIVVAIFLVGQFSLNFFTLVSPAILGFASNITPEQVIELTNQRRMENGLAPLRANGALNEIATRKAGDMFAFNYWAHSSPSGRNPWSFFQEVGYRYLYAGENLARDFMASEAVVEAWMNSPAHKDNVLSPHYREIGLAVVDGTLNGIETTLVVQVFGTPQPVASAEKPTPAKPSLGEAGESAPVKSGLVQTALAQATGEETVTPSVLSPFLLTKTVAVFLLGLIFGALALDALLVYRRKIVRLSGKNLAHLLFIGALLLAVLLTEVGAIL